MSQEQDTIFQLKGSMLAITLLELARYDLAGLERQLAEKVAQAPRFFDNTPLILALDKLKDASVNVDLRKLVELCRQHGLQTLAIRTDRQGDASLATQRATPGGGASQQGHPSPGARRAAGVCPGLRSDRHRPGECRGGTSFRRQYPCLRTPAGSSAGGNQG